MAAPAREVAATLAETVRAAGADGEATIASSLSVSLGARGIVGARATRQRAALNGVGAREEKRTAASMRRPFISCGTMGLASALLAAPAARGGHPGQTDREERHGAGFRNRVLEGNADVIGLAELVGVGRDVVALE